MMSAVFLKGVGLTDAFLLLKISIGSDPLINSSPPQRLLRYCRCLKAIDLVYFRVFSPYAYYALFLSRILFVFTACKTAITSIIRNILFMDLFKNCKITMTTGLANL
jgi:hypothetical protein